MAVASWRQGTTQAGPKEIHVGRRAGELKYWYKACQQVFASLPPWNYVEQHARVHVDVEIIHWSWDLNDLYVSRKRRLR